MYQLNILLIYSTEKDRKQVTGFLNENGYSVSGSFHAIENIDTLHFYPDVAIILTEIHGLLKTSLRIRKNFPSVQIVYSNCVPGTSVKHGLNTNELLEFLEKEKLSKKLNLIHFLRQITNHAFAENNAEQQFVELQMPGDVKPTYKVIADLIMKHRDRLITRKEKKELNKWRTLHPDNQRLFENLTDNEFVMEKLQVLNKVDAEDEWSKLKRKLSD